MSQVLDMRHPLCRAVCAVCGSASQPSPATLQALLRRQWLLKTRAWGATAAEVLSPILLMSLLVVAFRLVHPDHYQSRVGVDFQPPHQ